MENGNTSPTPGTTALTCEANLGLQAANTLLVLANDTQQRIWANKFYCKYSDIETEKFINDKKHLDKLFKILTDIKSTLKIYQEFLQDMRDRTIKSYYDKKYQAETLESRISDLKEIMEFRKEKYNSKLKEARDKYYETRKGFEAYSPFHKELCTAKANHTKNLIEYNMLETEYSRIIFAIKQRNEIWQKMFVMKIVNFVQATVDYKQNQKVHNELKVLRKEQSQLTKLYQQKSNENESRKKRSDFKPPSQSFKIPINFLEAPKLQFPTNIFTKTSKPPNQLPYGINPEMIQKLKEKTENRKRKFEEIKKREIATMRRPSSSKFNTSALLNSSKDNINMSAENVTDVKLPKVVPKSVLKKNNTFDKSMIIKRNASKLNHLGAEKKETKRVVILDQKTIISDNKNNNKENAGMGPGFSKPNMGMFRFDGNLFQTPDLSSNDHIFKKPNPVDKSSDEPVNLDFSSEEYDYTSMIASPLGTADQLNTSPENTVDINFGSGLTTGFNFNDPQETPEFSFKQQQFKMF